MATRMLDESILVHNPVCFRAFWSFPGVENQSFFYPDSVTFRHDDLVRTRRLPIT